MNPAAAVRGEKAAHPERFCADRACLWRVMTRDGVRPCPKHATAITGPANVPAPESLATRLKMLSRTPGAVIRIADARTLDVVCEDRDAANQVGARLQTAATMLHVTLTTGTWDEVGLRFQVVIDDPIQPCSSNVTD
jgi:hypothetical protein